MVAGCWSGQEGRSDLEGLAVVTGPEVGEVAWLPASLLADATVRDALGRLPALVAHGAKPLLRSLAGHPELAYLHRPASLEDVFLKLTGRDLRD